ncbi:ANTAR domain-containing protein [Cryptosporangium sp. NPDC048952]|uniref:ANTAR domain-containing protein n=1 Tax=Cryptosporangium sp. NPDC048952 TaxID=3363961 RepID=UPI0037244F4B
MEADDRLIGGGKAALPPAAAVWLAELSRIVLGDASLDDVLARVATLAQATIPGAVDVSVTLIVNERPTTAAAVGPVARDLDERQYEQGFGPCLDAARGGVVLVIADTATETRWPRYCPKALERGVRSVLSVPLPVQQHVVGAMNVYGEQPDAFPPEAVELTVTFAGYAAVAVANAQLYAATADLADGMRQAMASRAVIEQAKGILMSQHGCTAEEAFTQLTTLSQNANRKLRDIAAAIVGQVQRAARPGPASVSGPEPLSGSASHRRRPRTGS